uniref:Secreted protein n=1 Tax=Musa acuminata subsp. malaccensis TaxID=214687 RepID=A0A804HNE5_MUSAM
MITSMVLLSISSLLTDPTQTLMIHWCRKLLACTRPIVSSTRRPPDLGPRNMPCDKIIQLKTSVASVSESAWLVSRADVRNFQWNKWDDEVVAPLEHFG